MPGQEKDCCYACGHLQPSPLNHASPASHSPACRSVPCGIPWPPPTPHVLIGTITSLQSLLPRVPSFSSWLSGNPIRHHLLPLPLFPHPFVLQGWSLLPAKALRDAPSVTALRSTMIFPVATTPGWLLQAILLIPCLEMLTFRDQTGRFHFDLGQLVEP